MQTSFYNWARGNRLSQYAGLKMYDGHEFKYAPDYTYIEIPVSYLRDNKEGLQYVKKGLRNQHLQVVAACSLDVRGSLKVEVEPCPQLSEYGSVQAGYYIHPGSGEVSPSFYVTFRKDCDISEIPYAVRLYLRG
jgi:hypothetical protein